MDIVKPKYSIQIVRESTDFKDAFMSKGILVASAAQALAVI